MSEASSVFNWGVASGDPLQDRVVLWTRVNPTEAGPQKPSVDVTVEVSKDEEFASCVHCLTGTATADTDYTVKIDFQELEAGTVYWYRFKALEAMSEVGRTKTLPKGGVKSIKLAVFSCAKYTAGYFNAYGHAAEAEDLNAVVHLGDYIYETEIEDAGNGERIVRKLPEGDCKEAEDLTEYRKRYALCRTDRQLRKLHAKYPFIAAWDDHEIADNAWAAGAVKYGKPIKNFTSRKKSALRAYHEWMPTRQDDGKSPEHIYRSFAFGNLVELYMLETRLVARDKQLSYEDYFKLQKNIFNSVKRNLPGFLKDLNCGERSLLGSEQMKWLQDRLDKSKGSKAAWQVLGQQVLMGRMNLPAEISVQMQSFISESNDMSIREKWRFIRTVNKLTRLKERMSGKYSPRNRTLERRRRRPYPPLTQENKKRVSTVLPYNLDAWDGYPSEREKVLNAACKNDRNLVVLSGDTHNAWANDLRNADDKQVGVEFAGPGVSSEGIGSGVKKLSWCQRVILKSMINIQKTFKFLIEDLEYVNVSDRGYMMVSFSEEAAQAEWIYMKTVSEEEDLSERKRSRKKLKMLKGKGNRRLIKCK